MGKEVCYYYFMEVVKLKTPENKPLNTENAALAAVKEAPANIEAEQSVLGLLMLNNDFYGQVNEILSPDDFYEPVHKRIYGSIVKLLERGQVATPIVLKNQYDTDPALVDIGGAKYLMQLAQLAVQIQDIKELAIIIYDLALKRKLIELGTDLVNHAYKHDEDESARDLIETAEQELFTLTERGEIGKGFDHVSKPLKEALGNAEKAMRRTKKVVGITTGFIDLDGLLSGLNNSDLLILAGRPSMGKTALAINMAYNAAKEVQQEKNGIVGVFSLEMSSAQISARILAMGTGLDSNRIRKGEINEDEFSTLIQRCKELNEMPLWIDDTPALSISAVRTRARRLKRQYGLRLLVVDYLQLLRGSSKRSNESRVQEISEITQGLKAIAKELNIPVIALSQLSRAVEQREDKRPQLSDLRESGSIEQDADVVMFIYREEYYLMRKQPQENTAEHAKWQEEMEAARNITEVLVSKQRNGPVGKVKLRFEGSTTMFENLSIEFDEGS